MKLILTRHGETEENKIGVMQGHLPGHLSVLGLEQAEKLAKRLSSESIDCIYSSDLARAADTAKTIAAYHPNVPFYLTEELRERFLGSWQGKTKAKMGFKKTHSVGDMFPPDGETPEDLFARAEKFLHFLLHEHKNKVVLCVAHNGFNKVLIVLITGKPLQDLHLIKGQDNTAVSIYEFDEDKNAKIILENCTEHF